MLKKLFKNVIVSLVVSALVISGAVTSSAVNENSGMSSTAASKASGINSNVDLTIFFSYKFSKLLDYKYDIEYDATKSQSTIKLRVKWTTIVLASAVFKATPATVKKGSQIAIIALEARGVIHKNQVTAGNIATAK